MGKGLKYAVILVPVVALIAIGAVLGTFGVRPRALPLISPSAFDRLEDVGFWTAEQTYQKLFRNHLVLFGYDPTAPESLRVLNGFLHFSTQHGPSYDVVVSVKPLALPGLLPVSLPPKFTAEDVHKAAEPYLLGGKRVIVVLETPFTSKLIKTSLARKLQYESREPIASFSVLQQSHEDLASLREADVCGDADNLIFDKAETLRCLFLPLEKKLSRERAKKTYAAAVDEYGSDDYFIYLYR
jgi:hypothetical protein